MIQGKLDERDFLKTIEFISLWLLIYVFKLQQYFLSHVPGTDLDAQDTWAGIPQGKFHTPVTHLTSGLRHV